MNTKPYSPESVGTKQAERLIKPRALTMAMLLAVASNAVASTLTWNVSGTNDWNTAANWSGTAVPVAGDVVNITTNPGSPVVVNYSAPMSAASIGSLNIGYGATSTAGTTSTLNISASGFNVSGTTLISSGGIVNVNAGGVYTNSGSLTLGVTSSNYNNPLAVLSNTGGILTVSSLTTLNFGSIVLNSGTSTFNGITFANIDNHNTVTINGGINSLGAVIDNRDNSGASTSTGLLIKGGTSTATQVILGAGASWGNMNVTGGNFTVTGTGASFVIGQQSSAGRGGNLAVSGGVLTYSDTTTGILISNAANNVSTVSVSGGVVNAGKITLIGSSVTTGTGSATLNVTGGALYVGAGGIVSNAATTASGTTTSAVNFTSGTLAASADWSSSVQISTGTVGTNNATVLAADAGGTAHNITLTGGLSGSAGLIKSGAGTLTLGGVNNFGTTAVNAGALAITGTAIGGDLKITGASSSVNVGAGADYTASSVTFNNTSAQSGTLSNSGGTLTVNGLTTSTAAGTGNGLSITLSGGTTTFTGGVTFANNNSILNISGGVNSLGAFVDSRDSSGINSTTGLIISAGTTTASSMLLGGGSSGGNSGGNLNLSGGSLTVGGSFILGDTVTPTGYGRGGNINITGGTLVSTDAGGLVMGNANGALAQMTISGGTASFEKITLVSPTVATGSATVRLYFYGGATYLGSGGMVANTSGSSSIVTNFGNANTPVILGAKADWSSASNVTMALTGNSSAATIQAADASGVAHNITLNGVLTGTGGFTKTGLGTLALNGANNYTGATVVSAGTLALGAGAYSGTMTINDGAGLMVTGSATGGALVMAGTTSVGNVNAGASYNLATLTINGLNSTFSNFTSAGNLTVSGLTTLSTGQLNLASGTNTFNGITLAGIYDNKLTITGGVNSLGIVNDLRDSSASTTASGIQISGGTTTASKLLLGTGVSWGNLTLSGGSLTVMGSGSNFVLGQQSTAGRGASLVMTGGTLNYVDTGTGLLMSNAANNVVTATFSGGVTNLGKITLIGSGVTTGTGSATLNLSGGTVYVGAGGIVSNAATTASGTTKSLVNLNTGILAASADWSSSVAMKLGNNVTIQAADISGTAYNIDLSGILSGTGGLTKTGAGKLTLDGVNSYTGNTVVNAGELAVTNSLTSGTVNVNSGATLSGNGYLSGNVNVTSGTLNGSGLEIAGFTTFSGNSTLSGYTLTDGGVTVSQNGTLTLSGTTNGSVTMLSGATLQGTGYVIGNASVTSGTVNGSAIEIGGDATFSGTSTLAGSNTMDGTVYASGGSMLSVTGTTSAAFGVNVGQGATLAGNGRVIGDVSVNGGTVNGSGLTVQGASAFTGASVLTGTTTSESITVSSGTTTVSGKAAANTTVTVASGATLKNTGTTTSGTLSVAAGGSLNNNGLVTGYVDVAGLLSGTGTVVGNTVVSGTLAPGNSPGIATFNGDLTLTSSSVLSMEINGIGTAGLDYDQVKVSGQLTLEGVLNLSSLSSMTSLNETLVLILNSSNLATLNAFSKVEVGGVEQSINNGVFTYNGVEYLLSYSANTDLGSIGNDVTLTVVPEPSTWAMLVGSFGFLIGYHRARRNRS